MSTLTAEPRRADQSAAVGSTAAPRRAARPASLKAAWLPLAALCLAFFVEMVDNTVLTIALPTMGRDLHAGTTQLQWVTGAYSLTFGALLLTAGSIADRFGRRRTLLVGLAGFGLASALVWFVTDAGQLIALRALMGVAAAGMAPVTMSLVFRLFDDDKVRMRAMTLMIVIGMSSMALGPLVAGSALTAVNWHWLLFINTPIAAFAVVGVLVGVPKDQRADLHNAPLDIPAALLTMAFMGLGCYSLTSGVERGWTNQLTLACFAGAVVALIGFVLRERTAKHPMLDLELFRNRTVRGSALAQLGTSVAQMASMFLLIMHFQFACGWSPMIAGLANLPFVLTMMFGGPVSEQLMSRYGHRVTCVVSVVLMVVGLAGLAATVQHSYWMLVLPLVVLSLGLRSIMTVCAVALVEAMPQDRTSLGTALNDASSEIGTSAGSAIAGTALAAVVGTNLPEGVWPAHFVATFIHGEQLGLLVVAVIVGLIAGYGASTLTNSKTTEEEH